MSGDGTERKKMKTTKEVVVIETMKKIDKTKEGITNKIHTLECQQAGNIK